jgi:Cu+-exporting ATPase
VVLLGNRKLMADQGVEVGDLAPRAEALAARARTPIYVAVDGQALGIVAVSDPVKADSRAAIDRLHRIGLGVAMLTGDNRATAGVVADQVGIDEVIGAFVYNSLGIPVAAGILYPFTGLLLNPII